MPNAILNGPQAPENNPPIQPLNFQPSNYTISALALGIVTTATVMPSISAPTPVNFVIGQQVRFHIPAPYGTVQLDGLFGYVVGLPSSNQVTVGIDSSSFNAFRAVSFPQLPQISAIGDVNSGPINQTPSAEQTYINGSFINISPVQAA